MHRKEFIKSWCATCLSGTFIASLLQNCAGSKIVTAVIEGSELIISAKEFELEKTDPIQFRKYIIVQNDRLEYPVCVYRFDNTHYSALWMSCTHQGTELQVFGDKLHCPAHGSEFNSNGSVGNGPASDPLKIFPVTITEFKIKVSIA